MVQIPDPRNPFVYRMLSSLKINTAPFFVQSRPELFAEVQNCFSNVADKVKKDGGKRVYGWAFWQHDYMIEAEFHAIWCSPDNQLFDITPQQGMIVPTILFALDEHKTFDGRQTDNVRINTTRNPLVDDLIEMEKVKFRFLNKGDRANIIGEIPLEGKDIHIWEGIIILSEQLERMYYGHGTIDSPCFCGSGEQYKNCHRQYVFAMMKYP